MRTVTKSTASIVFTFLLVIGLSSFVNRSDASMKWKTYKNKDYKFEVKFPERPQISEEKSYDGNTISVQHVEQAQTYLI